MTELEKQIADYLESKEVCDGIYIVCITNEQVVCANICVQVTVNKRGYKVKTLGDFQFQDKAVIIHGYTPRCEVILTHVEAKIKSI